MKCNLMMTVWDYVNSSCGGSALTLYVPLCLSWFGHVSTST